MWKNAWLRPPVISVYGYSSSRSGREIFVIGGGQIYRELLPLCDKAYVTKVDRAFDADVYFPDLDQDPVWEQTEESAPLEQDGIIYRYVTYRRKK